MGKTKALTHKLDKSAILKLCSEISEKEGNGSIYSLGSKESILDIPRWSTGILDLDAITGGGIPEGRIIEIYGAEGAGKTSLAHHLSAQHELALNIPIEGTFDASRAKVFGNTPKQLLVYRARYGEQAFRRMIQMAQKGIPLIIVDSVPSLQPKDDIDKIKKAINTDSEQELRIGGVARLMTNYLPVLEDVIEVTGTTVIFINQIRDVMNALPFGETVKTPGGHKLKHSASVRYQVARKEFIKIKNYNPLNSANEERIGIMLKVKVTKSKVCEPFGEAVIPMFFDRGFVDFSEYEQVRKEIMKERKEKYKKMLQ